jgi:two-component system response regulator RpaA
MKTVLVIEDMAIFRDPIAASLTLGGYQVQKAADGVAGLEAFRAKIPDLVLLDLSMPGLDGLGVLRAIRREKAGAGTPVILLTALADKKFIVDAARLGVKDYLLKSRFSLSELSDRVRRALNPPAESAPAAADAA